ncbi:hypothetical protein Arub01_57250 [Actinomadura rubrobrunea]|uniref:Uncharacterized protein n=1 Tax=Actinomadura rubrobrunea TaxID=115335 RepID=A0A9W6Q3E1_9ACTN|nr:hypothetical protein [Actinomadura rubrobrunea]GLW67482.1 hypothetical protein Arub01_57250 [Actinomadura rubrobrunea]
MSSIRPDGGTVRKTDHPDQNGTELHTDKTRGTVRFAFYGCTPQRAETGRITHVQRAQQRAVAQEVIKQCGGQIVAEFFDTYTRHWTADIPPDTHRPWGQRPHARALIDALTTDTFDAVVIGDLSAATFGSTSVWDVVELLRQHHKTLWAPGIEGALDPDDLAQLLLVKVVTGTSIPRLRSADQ